MTYSSQYHSYRLHLYPYVLWPIDHSCILAYHYESWRIQIEYHNSDIASYGGLSRPLPRPRDARRALYQSTAAPSVGSVFSPDVLIFAPFSMLQGVVDTPSANDHRPGIVLRRFTKARYLLPA
jgi:hypothetical protein